MKSPLIIDTTNRNAIHFPSIQPQYANQALLLGSRFRTFSSTIKLSDFDFTDMNSKLFTLPYILHSAGIVGNHSKPANNLIHNSWTQKNRATLAMSDSGGFQIASGAMSPSQKDIKDIFDWQCKYSDVAMTMDVPLGALKGKNAHVYSDFGGCLNASLAQLQDYYNWGAENHRFLNVLQGRNHQESDDWYNAVRWFNGYGWAFSYNANHPITMSIIIWRILHLIKDGKFDKDEVWLHFLGAGDLKSAFMFTAIKQALNARFPHCAIEVSFDTSTPFLLGGKHLSLSLDAVITQKRMATPHFHIDKNTQQLWMGDSSLLPCISSEISKHVKKCDIVLSSQGKPWIDETSYLILQNHNVEMTQHAYGKVNAIYNDTATPYHYKVPPKLANATDEVFKILSEKDIKKSFSLLITGRSNKIIRSMYR